MDIGAAILAVVSFVLGGIFNAVVGAATAEYRARQDVKRADERDRHARIRSMHLAEIERTHRIVSADLIRLMAQVSGNEEKAERAEELAGPGASYEYLGDAQLVRDFFAFESELFYRRSGSEVSAHDYQRWVEVAGRAGRALDKQRKRALMDEPVVLVPQSVMQAIPSWREEFARRAGLVDKQGGSPASASDQGPEP
jgi:hypothetical protein